MLVYYTISEILGTVVEKSTHMPSLETTSDGCFVLFYAINEKNPVSHR